MTSLLYIGAHIDELSPVRTVPNELLSYIFVLCSFGHPIQFPCHLHKVPYQVTISHVCSRWRQIALNTGTLWSNVGISQLAACEYSRYLSIYRIWVGRAGSLPLTVVLYIDFNLYKFLLDFVVPFRLRTLGISVLYHQLSALSNLPNLDVEELVISLTDHYDDSDLELPHFMDRTRYISFQDLCETIENSEAMLNVFCSLWRQLRSLECDSPTVSLTAWLNVLHQAQSLEHCDLTIINADNGPLVKVSMPNLRSFNLNLLEVHPDIVIPLIAAPNITTLGIYSDMDWSSDTYNIIKQHHKLHQLHEISLIASGPTLHITQILEDAPMLRDLYVEARSMTRVWKALRVDG
jgi:hypothetical protein